MNQPAAPGALPSVRWVDECRGALQALAAMLPFVLTFGFLVYGVLGERAAQVGLSATLVAVVIGALVFVPLSRSRMPCASPSASASLILGGAVAAMAQDPLLAAGLQAGDGPALAALVAMVGLTVAGSGLLLALLGLSGAGQLVRFVPQPVLAGFMNGIAILIVVSQLPPLLGLPADSWWREGWRSLLSWQGLPLGVAIVTAVAMGVLQARWPRLPAPLVTLLVAGAAVAIVKPLLPADGLGRSLLSVGALDAQWPQGLALWPLLHDAAWPLLQRQGGTIATTALLLALIGALESVLSLAAVDQLLDARSNPDRELVALGAANMVSGALGGLPLVYLRLRAIATLSGGGRTRHAAWLGCLMIGAAFMAALPLIERLSTAVVAGVVVMLAWTLVDRWTRQLLQHWWSGTRSPELAANLAVVALVCGVTLVKGFVAGVAAGVLAAMVLFVRAMNRELVHNRYAADSFPSRRVYAAGDEALLAPQRRRIEILELEGALFFGNAERLWREAEAPAGGQARHELIVDLRRVSTIDASGAVALSQLAARMQRQGSTLRLAGVTTDNRHGRALRALGLALAAHDDDRQALRAHADIDQAVEAAEQRMLREARHDVRRPALEPADCDLLVGLDAAQRGVLLALLQRQRLRAGERLFAEGDPGDALYLLTEGSVSIIYPRTGQRFASLSPGMCFGETAVLDGGGRTADAVADEASTVWVLPAQVLDRLQREHPALAAQLWRNLSKHLSQRLRAASAGWRRAAQRGDGAGGAGDNPPMPLPSRVALNEWLFGTGSFVALGALLLWLAYVWLDPQPPRRVVLATGIERSAYDNFGQRYAQLLKAHGIEVVLRPTQGAAENLALLRQPDSGVDLAFVQGGADVAPAGAADASAAAVDSELVSLGNLAHEPVWLFYREDAARRHLQQPTLDSLAQLAHPAGWKLNVGEPGSGVPPLMNRLLEANRIEPRSIALSQQALTPAVVALIDGQIDALVIVSAPEAAMVQMLLQTPGIRLFDVAQAEAYSRRMPFLNAVTLPRGVVDLAQDLPPQDVRLVAPTATLLARRHLHPALVLLLVQAAQQVHGAPGWFQHKGEFPNGADTERALADEAARFYRQGAPWLQRYLPFWLANLADRMWVAILAIVAVLLPLSRVLPPLYEFRVRSRVFRWYGRLRQLEARAQRDTSAEAREALRQQLDEIEQAASAVNLPLSHADELYALKAHIQLVRQRLTPGR